jgi:hypothetical protein
MGVRGELGTLDDSPQPTGGGRNFMAPLHTELPPPPVSE